MFTVDVKQPQQSFSGNTAHTMDWLFMLLVNVSLKFQMLISNLRQYFLLKKCEKLLQCKTSLIFLTKNISVFGYKIKHLRS